MANINIKEIKRVIEQAYIQGVHGNQDPNIVKQGFHTDFAMLVLQDNALEKVNVDEWLSKLERAKVEDPDLWTVETRYTFELVDVSEYAAVAKLNVYKGESHFSTDYMLLYKIENEWKIVSKIYAVPSNS